MANLAEYVESDEVDSVDEITPGESAVLRRRLSKVAVYRVLDSSVTERSVVYIQVGCIRSVESF